MAKRESLAKSGNAESWQWMISFYEDLTARPQWQKLLPLLDLVKKLAASEQAQDFRAGQSLDALIISTATKHGLEDNDPYVFVQALSAMEMFLLEYRRGQRQHDLVEKHHCRADELSILLSPLLKRLWDETQSESAA